MGCCKTPKYTFSATLVGLVGTDREKTGWNLQKSSKSVVFAPLNLPWNISTLGIIIAKVRFSPTFVCRKFVCNVFGLSSVAVWMDATCFPRLPEKKFPPQNDVTMMSQVGSTLLQKCGAVSRTQWCLHWLPSSIHPHVMVDHSFCAKFWDSLDLKGEYSRNVAPQVKKEGSYDNYLVGNKFQVALRIVIPYILLKQNSVW